jgi:hypothetical protein
MNELSPSLGILSNMITPAVLILASGSLIMTTSQRLSRVVERVRKIAQEFASLDKQSEDAAQDERKRHILYTLLRKSARRSQLLTRAMRFLYVSLSLFVATSLSIGVTAVLHIGIIWIPTLLGLAGAVFLFVSSAILIIESRLTYSVIADEVNFVIESSKANAPPSAKKEVKNWRAWFGDLN